MRPRYPVTNFSLFVLRWLVVMLARFFNCHGNLHCGSLCVRNRRIVLMWIMEGCVDLGIYLLTNSVSLVHTCNRHSWCGPVTKPNCQLRMEQSVPYSKGIKLDGKQRAESIFAGMTLIFFFYPFRVQLFGSHVEWYGCKQRVHPACPSSKLRQKGLTCKAVQRFRIS